MRVILMILTVCALVMPAVCAEDKIESKGMLFDGVAAYVNSEMITIAEVMNEVRRSPWAGTSAARNEKRMREMYQATLKALVDRKLILAAANKSKMSLQGWAVENRVREIVANNFGGDRVKLHQLLADRKITFEEWKDNLNQDLLITAMRFKNVDSRVNPTPKEIRAEYESNKGRYQTERSVAVSMIILDPPQEEDEPSVKERARQIEDKLREGSSFASLARLYSKDAKASEGGSWGKVNPEDVFRKEICNMLNRLNPGETSPVIILDEYGYIVRKQEQQDSRALTFEEAAQYVEGNLRMKKSEELYTAWMKRLHDDSYVKIYELPNM